MARKKRSQRRSATLSIAVAAGFAVPVFTTMNAATKSGFLFATKHLFSAFTGWDYDTGRWNAANLCNGTIPVMLGVLVHRVASAFGVNRALASAGVPLIRI